MTLDPGQGRVEGIQYLGNRKEFGKFVWRGTGLELLTAGFYRFWLATNLRRYLWSRTVVAGSPLEYTGRPRELLIGFLIALAILAPFYLFYFGIGLIAESYVSFASIPLVVAFYFLSQFAAYRARRYRLTRTVWRGVRFGMGGSGLRYVMMSFLWSVFVLLTLGGAFTWREAALERYKMQNTHFGQLPGSFEGTGWGLLKNVWHLIIVAPFAFVFLIPIPFWLGIYRAQLWRWRIAGMRFGAVSFSSDIAPSAFYGRYWIVTGWFFLSIIIFAILIAGVVGVAGTSYGWERASELVTNPVLIALNIFIYVLLILAMNIVLRLYLVHDIWQRLVQSVTIFAIEAADEVIGTAESANAVGEGLSDGLDVGGF